MEVDDLLNVDAATFFLNFRAEEQGQSPGTLEPRLQKLATVGDLSVSSTVDVTTYSRTGIVTLFDPHEGRSPKGLIVETVQDGQSPFRAFVLPGKPSYQDTTAYDYSNV